MVYLNAPLTRGLIDQENMEKKGSKLSTYGVQLFEKQKLRATYNMREEQFARFVRQARRKKGNIADNLLKLLESRLDNLVYRMGVARTIFNARQLVSHGHILVNERKVDIPSYLVKPGNVIRVSEKMKKSERVRLALEQNKDKPHLPYLMSEEVDFSVKFIGIHNATDIPNKVNTSKVIEFYSK